MMLMGGVSGGSRALPVTVGKAKYRNSNLRNKLRIRPFWQTARKVTYTRLGKRITVGLYRVPQYS